MKIIFSVAAAIIATFVLSNPVMADDPPVCEEGQTENCVLLE